MTPLVWHLLTVPSDLKTRNDQDFRAFPLWLHLAKEAAESNAVQWHRISLRLRYLHCCLLLEQLSIKKVQSDQQHLIDVAREMLELTVCMWVERDRFMDRLYDYDWMVNYPTLHPRPFLHDRY